MIKQLAGKLRFYFDRSLIGYLYSRVKSRWIPVPARIDYHGVQLQIDSLSREMQAVLLSGGYEIPELKLIPGFITSTDCVLELGGAIGFIGLYCLKQIGVSRCITVEPNPITLAQLRHNYALNGIEANVIQAAISAKDAPVSFYVSEMFWTDSLVPSSSARNCSAITVEGLTFPSLWQRAGGNFNTLIIDVEGAEQHLSGAAIPPCVNKLLIEIHPDIVGTRTAYAVLESLIRSGFTVLGHEHNTWAVARSNTTN